MAAGLTAGRALDLLDYSREALIGRAVEDLLPRDRRESHARLRRAFQASPSARTMGALKEPLVAVQRSGSTIPVDISLGPIHTDEGLLVVTSIRDMRAHIQAEERRRSLEQHLRHSQKLEALGTLAGGIAHDFNNILAAITANLELARVELGQQHAVAPRLLEIATATQRATLLVRQILAFSRRQAPRRAVIPLAPVVQEAVQLLRHTLPPRIALDIIIDPDIPPANQRLRLRARTAGQAVRWELDGRTLAPAQAAAWFPAPGRHTLRLLGPGTSELDRIEFEVRGVNYRDVYRHHPRNHRRAEGRPNGHPGR